MFLKLHRESFLYLTQVLEQNVEIVKTQTNDSKRVLKKFMDTGAIAFNNVYNFLEK